MKKVSSTLPLVALAAAALALFLADLAIGSVHIPIAGVIQSLENRSPDPVWKSIVLVFRLPKAITAALAGGALAVSGLILQTVFRNPLAGPDSLGIGAGASIGVALVVLAAGSAGGRPFSQALERLATPRWPSPRAPAPSPSSSSYLSSRGGSKMA